MGVNLDPTANPGKALFFNDREGTLVVRATAQDLDMVEAAVEALNIAPPLVTIRAKFIEVTQNDIKSLGFDWYIGNFLMGNGTVVGGGGAQPPLNGAPSAVNPGGVFPAGGLAPGAGSELPGLITSGLRNGVNTAPAAPALASFTGILTDPQFRVVIRALEQRDGAEALSDSQVTTMSGRQTQIQAVDIQYIAVQQNVNQTATGGGAAGAVGATGGGVGQIGTTIVPTTTAVPLGPTLDVVPYVSADGYTIQMTIIPSVLEFLGYDDPGQFGIQAQSAGGTTGASQPLTAVLPLPHFRLRQVTTSAIVWDGQTIVLGGLITEAVTKQKDKVPVLGDLPFIGRLFRNESNVSKKRNLVIFTTPKIIDPAGNPLHNEDDLPFAQNAIPTQKPVSPNP